MRIKTELHYSNLKERIDNFDQWAQTVPHNRILEEADKIVSDADRAVEWKKRVENHYGNEAGTIPTRLELKNIGEAVMDTLRHYDLSIKARELAEPYDFERDIQELFGDKPQTF